MLAPAKSLKIKFVNVLLYQANKKRDVPMSASAYLKIVLHMMCVGSRVARGKGGVMASKWGS
jgi:hypothetical protein